MPQMGGGELARRLQLLQPELRIVFTSGYPNNVAPLSVIPEASFLQKPYGLAELARVVHGALV